MILKTFVFNPFQVNTYLLYDESLECIIIDCACNDSMEQEELLGYISANELKPVKQLLTHGHIDHIPGLHFARETLGAKLYAHEDTSRLLISAPSYGEAFGFGNVKIVQPDFYVKQGDIIEFGKSTLEVLHTPGHAMGSICFYSKADHIVITGDVLFCDSIGRTDLPSGDHTLLIKNIREKLLVMPDETIVYPGHGPKTSIGHEKENNPFLQ